MLTCPRGSVHHQVNNDQTSDDQGTKPVVTSVDVYLMDLVDSAGLPLNCEPVASYNSCNVVIPLPKCRPVVEVGARRIRGTAGKNDTISQIACVLPLNSSTSEKKNNLAKRNSGKWQ